MSQMGIMIDPIALLNRMRGMPQPIPAAPGTFAPGPYVTTLQPQDEASFQAWVKANNVPWQDTPNADYDMRGYFKDNVLTPGTATKTSAFDGLPHYPDTYKTPFHKSFSNESKYATPNAPKWQGDRLIAKDGTVIVDETPALTPEAATKIRQKAQ